eukprot:2110650-Rhodomonas_salina.1
MLMVLALPTSLSLRYRAVLQSEAHVMMRGADRSRKRCDVITDMTERSAPDFLVVILSKS